MRQIRATANNGNDAGKGTGEIETLNEPVGSELMSKDAV
jgi:hypothetical protein